MAISNWLTRDEWNAVFFAGLEAAHKYNEEHGKMPEGPQWGGLGGIMHFGMGALAGAGYKFTGIDAQPNGDYEKVRQCCGGNERVLAEFIDGTFSAYDRSRELLRWLKNHEDLKHLFDLEEMEKMGPSREEP